MNAMDWAATYAIYAISTGIAICLVCYGASLVLSASKGAVK